MAKQLKHEKRKSFRKWGLAGQLTAPMTTKAQVKATAMNKDGAFNIPLLRHINRRHNPTRHSPPAINLSRQIQFGRASILSQPCGVKAKTIPAHQYHPQPKAPSRRDRYRAAVAQCKL